MRFELEREQLSDQSVYQFPTLRAARRPYRRHKERPRCPRRPQGRDRGHAETGRPEPAPLFVIASSGGTLGAYDRLSKALKTSRAIVGIRDPFVWGGREPTMGFQDWISIYLAAMRERQPDGTLSTFARFRRPAPSATRSPSGFARTGQRSRAARSDRSDRHRGQGHGDFGFKVFAAMFAGRRRKLRSGSKAGGDWVTGAEGRSSRYAGDNNFTMTSEEFHRRAAGSPRQDAP